MVFVLYLKFSIVLLDVQMIKDVCSFSNLSYAEHGDQSDVTGDARNLRKTTNQIETKVLKLRN